jgi:hypothetical protein
VCSNSHSSSPHVSTNIGPGIANSNAYYNIQNEAKNNHGVVTQSIDSLSKQGTPNKKNSVVKKLQIAVQKQQQKPILSQSPRQSMNNDQNK